MQNINYTSFNVKGENATASLDRNFFSGGRAVINELIEQVNDQKINNLKVDIRQLEKIELTVLNGLIVLHRQLKKSNKQMEISVSNNTMVKKAFKLTGFDSILPLIYKAGMQC